MYVLLEIFLHSRLKVPIRLDGPMDLIHTRFDYLKRNLNCMAEQVLEQALLLCDALENNDYSIAEQIIRQDDLLDHLEKENDNISQSVILEAVVNRTKMGMNSFAPEISFKQDPLRFALSAIRINRHFERIGDNMVGISRSFMNDRLPQGIFLNNSLLHRILARFTTAVGMAVESLVEEKKRFFGSIKDVDEELSHYCKNSLEEFLELQEMTHHQISDIQSILFHINRVGDLSVNIGEELIRLSTGEDIRHLDLDSSQHQSVSPMKFLKNHVKNVWKNF